MRHMILLALAAAVAGCGADAADSAPSDVSAPDPDPLRSSGGGDKVVETHPNGLTKSEGFKRDGRTKVGYWTYYWPNGQKLSEGEYQDGKKHGPWTSWDDAGRTTAQGEYLDGSRTGPWRAWVRNPDGSLHQARTEQVSGIYEAGQRIAELPDK